MSKNEFKSSILERVKNIQDKSFIGVLSGKIEAKYKDIYESFLNNGFYFIKMTLNDINLNYRILDEQISAIRQECLKLEDHKKKLLILNTKYQSLQVKKTNRKIMKNEETLSYSSSEEETEDIRKTEENINQLTENATDM